MTGDLKDLPSGRNLLTFIATARLSLFECKSTQSIGEAIDEKAQYHQEVGSDTSEVQKK